MRIIRNSLASSKGETLVEILCAGLIFTIILGILTAAVQFTSRAQVKGQALRDNAATVQTNLRTASATGTSNAKYSFKETDAAGTTVGSPAFSVQVQLQTKTVQDDAHRNVDFYVVGPKGG